MRVDVSLGSRQARVVSRLRIADSATDADLVVSAQQGNRDAFGALYERFAPMVHGVILSRGAVEDVDDLVQDVFVTALERLHTLRAAAAFPGWLAAIARNRVTDRLRMTLALPLTEEMQASTDEPDLDARAVLALIRTLPDAYRETLTLRLVEGMTGPEIAARTGLTEGSVRVNLHRGMGRLRAKLQGRRSKR
jgi:RNA polymerase sigma-70 factor, ECF subfamily